MKIRKNVFAGILAVLVFTACGSAGPEGPPPPEGRVTLVNFTLEEGSNSPEVSICSNPNHQFRVINGQYWPATGWETIGSGYANTDNTSPNYMIADIDYSGGYENFTGSASVYIRIDMDSFCYNNVTFSNGNATINYNDRLVPVTFQLPQTEGEFTLNNASGYDNKYVIMVGAVGTQSPTALYGFKSATSTAAFIGKKIVDGTVTLPVYKITYQATEFTSYTGSDAVTSLVLIMMDTENFDYQHYAANTSTYKYLSYISGVNGVTFASGKCTADAANGTKVPASGW